MSIELCCGEVVCYFCIIFSWTTTREKKRKKIIKIHLDHNSCEMQFQQFCFVVFFSPFEIAIGSITNNDKLALKLFGVWLIKSHWKRILFLLWFMMASVDINKQLLIFLFSILKLLNYWIVELWLRSHLENWITCCSTLLTNIKTLCNEKCFLDGAEEIINFLYSHPF